MPKMLPLRVSLDRCHELLEVCEPSPDLLEIQSGLKWKVNKGTARAGSWAGALAKFEQCGKPVKYWQIGIDGKIYRASRIIYFMHHGVDPFPMEVDHADINSLNNSVENLRLADRPLQGQNQGIKSNNKSGVKGVSWHKRASKWQAHIKVGDKQKYLGLFKSLKEAAAVKNEAIREFYPEETWAANLVDLETIGM